MEFNSTILHKTAKRYNMKPDDLFIVENDTLTPLNICPDQTGTIFWGYNMNDYETALKVLEEHKRFLAEAHPKGQRFEDWLKEKTTPADPMREAIKDCAYKIINLPLMGTVEIQKTIRELLTPEFDRLKREGAEAALDEAIIISESPYITARLQELKQKHTGGK